MKFLAQSWCRMSKKLILCKLHLINQSLWYEIKLSWVCCDFQAVSEYIFPTMLTWLHAVWDIGCTGGCATWMCSKCYHIISDRHVRVDSAVMIGTTGCQGLELHGRGQRGLVGQGNRGWHREWVLLHFSNNPQWKGGVDIVSGSVLFDPVLAMLAAVRETSCTRGCVIWMCSKCCNILPSGRSDSAVLVGSSNTGCRGLEQHSHTKVGKGHHSGSG